MKFVAGVPQFEEKDYDRANYMGGPGVTFNQKLREAFEKRQCGNCAQAVWDPYIPEGHVECARNNMIERDDHWCKEFKTTQENL